MYVNIYANFGVYIKCWLSTDHFPLFFSAYPNYVSRKQYALIIINHLTTLMFEQASQG